MIGLIPSYRPHHRRPSKRDWRWRLRIGAFVLLSAVATFFYAKAFVLVASTHIHLAFVLFGKWDVFVLLYFMAYLETPFGAFGSIAAIVFAVGWYCRWPAPVARWKPWVRGATFLAIVSVAHGIWFQFGWVPFRPPCFVDNGSLVVTSHQSVVGPMTPEAALEFVDTLNYRDRDVAWLSGPNTVVARPAMVLFDDSGVWNNTMKIATALAREQALPPPDFDQRDECAELERIVMVGGKAESRAVGWGTWPWSTFDENGDVVRWLRDVAR